MSESYPDLPALAAEATTAGALLAGVVERLSVALEVPRSEIDRAVEAAVGAGRRLREGIARAADATSTARPGWSDGPSLAALVSSLAEGLERLAAAGDRERLEALADELRHGTFRSSNARRAETLEAYRAAASSEVDAALLRELPSLPWPPKPNPSWVHALALLDDAENALLTDALPALCSFLVWVDADSWTSNRRIAEEPEPGEESPGDHGSQAVVVPGTADVALVDDVGPATLPARIQGPSARTAQPNGAAQASKPRPAPPVGEALGSAARITDDDEADPDTSEPRHPRGPRYVAPAALVPPLVKPHVCRHQVVPGSSSAEPPAQPSAEPAGDLKEVGPEEAPAAPSSVGPSEAPSPVSSVPASEDERPSDVIASMQPPEASQLPAELCTFAAFRRAYWRDATGALASAPWEQPDFAAKLEDHAEIALREGEFGRLLLISRAAEALQIESVPPPDDVRALIGRLGGPRTVSAESDSRRARLLAQASEGVLQPTLATRLAVILEAISSSPSRPLAPAEAEMLVEGADLSNAFSKVLLAVFSLGGSEDDPIRRLQAVLQELPMKSPAELESAIAKAEAKLRSDIIRLWSGAGGRIERTHCRDAWHEFVEKAQPVLNEVLERKTWDEVKRLDGLLADHAKIADRFGAARTDRDKMDRAARQLVDGARAVVSARREAGRHARALRGGHGLPELVEAHRALPRHAMTGTEPTYVPLFDRLLERRDGTNEGLGSLRTSELTARPALLATLPDPLGDGAFMDVDAIAFPIEAAAHLMDAAIFQGPSPRDLSRHLRDLGREDLLAHVRPASDTDAKFAAGALGKAQAAANRVLSAAVDSALPLNQLAHPALQQVNAALAEAKRLLADGPAQENKPELLQEWVTKVTQFATAACEESIPGLREALSRQNLSPDDQARFERALENRQFAEALALAHGAVHAPATVDRAMLWRASAAQEFRDPRRTLKGLPTHQKLRRLWLDGIRGPSSDDELRSEFVSFVFDAFTRVKSNIRNPKARRETLIGTELLRKAIAKDGLNPTFMPQITAFKDVAILTPTVATTEDTFVRTTAELLARGTEGRITLLLAPRVSEPIREALREELRKRNIGGVGIVDDLDLVRLFNPGRQQPSLVLGLFEIVLEQQSKWSHLNPFESQEGQHTKAEMFVGRTDEAKGLSQAARYSRVFSGRRLGKSALLKHIHDAQDGSMLPSRNSLRVVYVPIVGLDSEEAVVDKIIECFSTVWDGARAPDANVTPGARLKAVVDAYLRAEPTGSVLLFLDEADMFVEEQAARYEREREKCLTWRMRTELESHKDSMDLPRVRFVFAGYRATHRAEGAWANWGDVLRLRPLAPDDAARLIAGPLSRLGINASAEASAIAYRCGYQPAILVRFGQQLIAHLDMNVTPGRRDAVVVTPEQVTTVYQSPDVQQEIRTIVWNNFQGNPFGKVVFAALLLEFARTPPGAAVDDAPSRVLQRLRALVPDFLSVESLDGTALDRVARALRDFVDRTLILEVQAATQSYQLRFPHQLHVLLSEDQEAAIRREAPSLGGARLDAIEEVRSMIPHGALEDLACAVTTDGLASAAIVATHWSAAVGTGAADVRTRLDYSRDQVVDMGSRPAEDPIASARVAVNASAAEVEQFLKSRATTRVPPLLVGGMDLLRWGLARGRDVEVATVGRLSQVQLRWWFERVREVSFTGPNPVPGFLELTGGIPYLVGILDDALRDAVGFDGTEASEASIASAVAAYEAAIAPRARALADGPPAIALSKREQELLVMLTLASAVASSRKDLVEMLVSPREYAEYAPGLDRWPGLGLGTHDLVALDVLLRAGLLPADPAATSREALERLHVVPATDPIHRIGKVLAQCLSP